MCPLEMIPLLHIRHFLLSTACKPEQLPNHLAVLLSEAECAWHFYSYNHQWTTLNYDTLLNHMTFGSPMKQSRCNRQHAKLIRVSRLSMPRWLLAHDVKRSCSLIPVRGSLACSTMTVHDDGSATLHSLIICKHTPRLTTTCVSTSINH